LCEDLLSTSDRHPDAACRVDSHALAKLMAEIDDPGLRTKVLKLCVAAIEADAHVADGEALIIAAAFEQWDRPLDAKRPQDGNRRMGDA